MPSYGVNHLLPRNKLMSNLTRKFFAAACATASQEHLISEDSYVNNTQDPVAEDFNDAPDTTGDAGALDRVIDLVDTVSEAQDAEEAVRSLNTVRENLQETRDVVEVLNEDAGGVSVECYPLVAGAFESLANKLNQVGVNLKVSVEQLALQKRVKVGLEGVDNLLDSVDRSQEILIQNSQDRIRKLTQSLRETLPEARDRLMALLSDVDMASEDRDGKVMLDESTKQALSVDGVVPEDLVSYFSSYADYGSVLTGEYVRRSNAAVDHLSGLLGSLNYETPEGFWDSLSVVLDKISDPREALSADQLAMALPCNGALFETEDSNIPEGNPTFQKLVRFIKINAPQIRCEGVSCESDDTIDTTLTVDTDAAPAPVEADIEPGVTTVDAADDVDDGDGIKCLTREQLRVIGKALMQVTDPAAIEQALTSIEKSWPVTQATVGEARDTIRSVTGMVAQALGSQLQLVPRYFETLHALAIWPTINYLTNLILTTNAVVVMGGDMLHGELETAQEPVDNTTAETEPPADEPTPVDETATADATDGAVPGVDDATDPAAVTADETGLPTDADIDAGAGDTDTPDESAADAASDETPPEFDTDLPPDTAEGSEPSSDTAAPGEGDSEKKPAVDPDVELKDDDTTPLETK